MNHKISLHGVIFVSSLLSFVVLIPKTNGILTDTNELDCTQVQCPNDCPADSYIKSLHHEYDDFDKEDIEDLDDYVEDLITPEPYNEEYGHFEELPPEVEMHETNLQHSIKERQKREVFFQEDIDRCCGHQKCICKGCADVPKCMADEVAIAVEEGKGEPGSCCSQYKCVKKEKCAMGVKQTWWKNKCTKCSCFGEDDMCIQHCTEEDLVQNCFSEYLQKPMMNGASWKEGRCISCTCERGERRCFAPKLEDDCHPLYKETKDKEEGMEVIEESVKDLDVTTTKDQMLVTSEESSTHSLQESTIASTKEVKEILIEEVQNTTQITFIIDTSTLTSVENKSTEVPSTFSKELEEEIKTLTNSSTLETYNSTTSVEHMTPTVAVVNSTIESEVSVKSLDNSSMFETQTSTPLENVTTSTFSSAIDIESTDKIETTEIPKSLLIEDPSSTSSSLDNSSTTVTSDIDENLQTTSSTTTVKSEIQIVNEIATEETVTENVSNESYSKEAEILTSTTILPNTSPTTSPYTSPTDSTTSSIIDISSTEVSSTSMSTSTSVSTDSSSTSISTSTSASTDSSSTEKILSTNISETNSDTSSSTPTIDTTTFATSSTPTEAISSTSKFSTSAEVTSSSSTTSSPSSSSTSTTTSSPYTSSTFFSSSSSSSPSITVSSSTSSTSAPIALEPIFQPVFGEFDKEERANTETQNQLRHMFDEIDYVVMIVLFIGSLLCISLGLIIRHTKNRKKMYSSIPNSETSLSQTSTNTMMTV